MLTPQQRFWQRVDFTDGCWHWTGSLTDGYGHFTADGETKPAHVWSHLFEIGDIPTWADDIDHRCHNADPACAGGATCRHRACVRPSHLAAATHRTNVLNGKGLAADNARKLQCGSCGASFSDSNTRLKPNKIERVCKRCERTRKRKARRHASLNRTITRKGV